MSFHKGAFSRKRHSFYKSDHATFMTSSPESYELSQKSLYTKILLEKMYTLQITFGAFYIFSGHKVLRVFETVKKKRNSSRMGKKLYKKSDVCLYFLKFLVQ